MSVTLSPLRERDSVSDRRSDHMRMREPEDVPLAVVVAAALGQSHYSGLRSLEVSVEDGVVLLRGVVASFHLKQLAQQTVLRVLGKSIIRNDLDVGS